MDRRQSQWQRSWSRLRPWHVDTLQRGSRINKVLPWPWVDGVLVRIRRHYFQLKSWRWRLLLLFLRGIHLWRRSSCPTLLWRLCHGFVRCLYLRTDLKNTTCIIKWSYIKIHECRIHSNITPSHTTTHFNCVGINHFVQTLRKYEILVFRYLRL
jgi:hypothetical protein